MRVTGWPRVRSRPRRPARLRRRDAAIRGRAEDWLLEDRCLLTTVPTNGPIPMNFGNAPIDKVLYNGVQGSFAKTVTITNSSPDQFLYAFLEGEVSRQAVDPYEGTGAFDPYDASNQEYRGYIGYSFDGGKTSFAGLPPQTSITITVPLAFWDSARIIFSTDGADQFTTVGNGGSPPGAPFYFHTTNTQAIFYGNISAGSLNQINFTPIFNSFVNGKPASSSETPISSGLFKDGQSFVVTGPGLPAGGYQVTIDAKHPNTINLPVNAGGAQTAQQYVFTALAGQSISPTDRNIQAGFPISKPGSPGNTNGVVMWYHALTAQQPNNDAPFQLTEVTFRGTFYDPKFNPGTDFKAFLAPDDYAGAITDSADYDISFVDTINLPVAMEATNATIPNTGTSAPFGWVGSGQSIRNFQDALLNFTEDNPETGGTPDNVNSLGTYFKGQGYPSYLVIDKSTDPTNLKLPAGQNLFLASPAVGGAADVKFYMTFSDKTVINEPLFALTSGGPGPIKLSIGGDSTHPSAGHFLGLNTAALANNYALTNFIIPNITKGLVYTVTYNDVNGKPVFVGNATGLYYAADKKTVIGVELDRDVPTDPAGRVYDFTQPLQDYAASRIAGLWYSWAEYYADHVPSTPRSGLAGTIGAGNILTLNSPVSGLVPGMVVTSADGGIPAGTVILSVASDQKTIHLSAVVTGRANKSFNFAAPSFGTIVGFDPKGNTPHVDLSFPVSQQAFALAFSETVFTVMSAWSASIKPGTANAWDPLLVNIIGGNLGTDFLPNVNTDAKTLLTDLSKSALRGVPDFTSPLYSNPAQWYPDPAVAEGSQTYNVFNLDPFVWFIHDKLGLTAYAFALDDDIGNVNAGGATHLAIDVGGLDSLPNKDPFTNASPWGVVQTGTTAPSPAQSSILKQLTNPTSARQIAQYNYSNNIVGTLVNGPGVARGTTVQFTDLDPTPSKTQLVLSSPLTSDETNPGYSFFGALTFTATVPKFVNGQAGDTILLNSPDAYNTLLKLGPLATIQVTGEGIAPTQVDTIKGLTKGTDGVIRLQLTNPLDPALVSHPGDYYAYTFGGSTVGIIHDPGFEWRDVSGVTGQFNHGAQLSAITPDWTFTDSPTQPKSWFAGIAFGTTSTYTTGSPPPPQALQVGFIQGDSRISQTLTLGKGTYTFSLDAIQRSTNLVPQSLDVLVDGVPVGKAIQPSGPAYQPFTVQFTITAPGQHTITLQGMESSDSTILIDALSAAPVVNPSPGGAALRSAIPDQEVSLGSTVSFTAATTGPATFALAAGAPAGARIDPTTGLFTFTPPAPGLYAVTVLVNGGSPPLGDADTVTIDVEKAASFAVLSPSVARPTYGRSQFFGAAVARVPGLGVPTGTIQFVVDGLDFGLPVALVNGAAISPSVATLGAGIHYVAAVYSGDADYASIATPLLTETVAPAPLTIVVNNATRAFGQPNPLPSASYFGFVNGDTAASLTTPVVLWATANQFSPVGTYAIWAWGASSPNYAITLVPGTLTVTAPPAGASPTDQRWTAFATTLYEEVLGRNPDSAGLAFWVRVLEQGVAPAAVTASFWNSPEHILLTTTNRGPRIAQATALADALTAGQIAFGLAPRGPLSLTGGP